MGRFDTTKATINANIKSNGNQEITGSVLNSVLQEMVDGTDAQLTELSAEVINEVNRKGFLIDASIEGWTREDYNLYIDYIYRNDPNYGSGIRVIDEQGATIVYMVFQDTKKKGIDKVSQDTEYGKVTLVVNWDYFNDGYNAILENRIAVPNTAFLNTTSDLFAQYDALSAECDALSAECDDLSTRLNVGCEGVLINITDKYYTPIQLSAPLKAGMIVESIADATGVYFRNKQGAETYYGADSFPLSLKEDIYEVVPTSNATGNIVVKSYVDSKMVALDDRIATINSELDKTIKEVNKKGFLIDASIEGWKREDYDLYIDFVYRNDPNYGSGIRVIDANGSNVAYMNFSEYKKGIDEVSQDTEYGKITLVVNWDYFNDGYNALLQNKIIIPNTAFKKSDSSKEESVKVHLPSTIYAVVGDTLQVFYRGCVQAVNPYNYNILVTCDKGKQFPRYWEYIPTSSDIGTTTLKISVRDNSLNVLASTTCKVVTIAKGTNPSSIMNVACFGDSLTAGGDWCAEAARRLTGEGGQPSGDNLNNIAFVGKKKKDGYGYYGEGGWTWKSYTTKDAVIAYRFFVKDVSSLSLYATYSLGGVTYTINEINVTSGVGNILCVPNGNATPPSSGTMTKVTGNGDLTIAYTNVQQVAMNPLWDESNNKMSFVPYANDYCNGEIDLVYTLLTWNNLWTNKESFSDIIDDVKIFADTLHREFPSAKLKIMGIQIPSVTGGMGANYGSSGEGYADQYGMAITAFKLNSAYKDFASQDAYKDFVEYIDVASQFDTEYNMPYEMAKVNVRSSQTEMRGTNGVHPSMEGYMQIADVVYRSICSEL